VSGYRKAHAELVAKSEATAAVDASKAETLEEISALVNTITQELKVSVITYSIVCSVCLALAFVLAMQLLNLCCSAWCESSLFSVSLSAC
jgi:hypothetical protein